MNYLSRYESGEYESGEYEQVWMELYLRYGKEVQSEPFFSEALEVARATMRCVRHNIEMLIPRLEAIGYQPGYGESNTLNSDISNVLEKWVEGRPPVSSSPLPDIEARFLRLVESGIFLPISVRAWYEIVGSVNLHGVCPPRWGNHPVYAHDPLQIDPLAVEIIDECVEEKRLCISPDEFHKYHVSGSGPYYIDVHHPCADRLVEGGWLKCAFVEYLRVAFSWGGYPGIGRWHKRPEKDIAFLTEGLLEF